MIYIHQPNFLPWLGMVDAMARTDVFVVYDDVQYEDGGWQNRNKVIAPTGTMYITVPVKKNFGQKINEVATSDVYDPKLLVKMISSAYSNVEHYQYSTDLFKIFEKRHSRLVDLNMDILRWIKAILGLNIEILLSSELDLPPLDKKARIFYIMRQLKKHTLFCGSGAKNYLTEKDFTDQGLSVTWQNFELRHPVYQQKFKSLAFQPNLSFIDMLFMVGPEKIKAALLGCRGGVCQTI